MKPFLKVTSVLIAIFIVCHPVTSAPFRTDHLAVELVAERTGLVPGETNTVAVRMEMDDHWHTYWENPGDSGLAAQIDWTLPEGVTAGPIQWPAPQWIELFGLVSYAYEGEIFLLVDLEVADQLASTESVKLSAQVDFLICKEACIPGAAAVSLQLPVAHAFENSKWKSDFDASRNAQPQKILDWDMKVVDNGNSFALTVAAPKGKDFAGRDVVYFSRDGWVAPSKPRTSLAEDRILTLVLPKTEYEPDTDKNRFQGVLTSSIPWDEAGEFSILEVNLPFSENDTVATWVAGVAGNPEGTSVAFVEEGEPSSLLAILGFAFLGGMLLNLMPCVFPVLSIKVLDFVQRAGEDSLKIKAHGSVFTFGVLISFWVLAAAFLGLRAAGEEIGWGFHMQSPGFVAIITSILFLFGLNLSGVFEIGEAVTGTGSQLQTKPGYSGSFFSGVLATLVATPCTAPFLGTAVGAIAAMSSIEAFLTFTAIALGVSAPYLFLSFFPALIQRMPRPGAWMETFKKALAFLLYASAVWLAWVFGSQVGVTGMALLLMALVLLGVGAWVYGNWGNLIKKRQTRLIAFCVTLIFMFLSGYLQFFAAGLSGPAAVSSADLSSADYPGITWDNYSAESVASFTSNGKTVYVDFTATWCLTCQVNKKVAFGNDQVIQYFEDNGIVALKGDWTKRDPLITRELQRFGRNGVPTNVIYRPDGSSHLLPEVLTPGIVLEALKNGAEG